MDPFEALGDPHRRTILALLGDGDRSVQQLADALPISRPAVSRHLRLLKEAGLVTDRAEGTRRLYRLQARAPRPCAPTSSRSGATRRPASRSRRRTPSERARQRVHGRLPARARLVGVGGADVAVVAGLALRLGRARGRRDRAARRRPDLRAGARRRGARVGPRGRLGAAEPARLHVAPAPGRRRRDRGRDHLRGGRRRRHGGADRAPRLGAARRRGAELRERNVRGWAGAASPALRRGTA